MDVIDHLYAVQQGKLSRRAFRKALMGVGVGLVSTPLTSRRALAQDGQGTFFTWGGYDIPELYGEYEAKHGALPEFSIFGGTEEALTKTRSGFVVDVAHPCNVGLLRWVDSGLFQPIDTARLSNWGDVMPSLVDMEGNDAGDGRPWLVPFDWGQTSITYRTDIFELEGEETLHELGQIGDLETRRDGGAFHVARHDGQPDQARRG